MTANKKIKGVSNQSNQIEDNYGEIQLPRHTTCDKPIPCNDTIKHNDESSPPLKRFEIGLFLPVFISSPSNWRRSRVSAHLWLLFAFLSSVLSNNMIPKRNICLYRAVKCLIYYSDKRNPGSYNSLSLALPVYVVFFCLLWAWVQCSLWNWSKNRKRVPEGFTTCLFLTYW